MIGGTGSFSAIFFTISIFEIDLWVFSKEGFHVDNFNGSCFLRYLLILVLSHFPQLRKRAMVEIILRAVCLRHSIDALTDGRHHIAMRGCRYTTPPFTSLGSVKCASNLQGGYNKIISESISVAGFITPLAPFAERRFIAMINEG